jgi:hypothetical protein
MKNGARSSRAQRAPNNDLVENLQVCSLREEAKPFHRSMCGTGEVKHTRAI